MVGREVSVSNSATGPVHGIVTKVFMETGKPKIMVSGTCYSLDQILSVSPLGLG
jgi:hypothetical protein